MSRRCTRSLTLAAALIVAGCGARSSGQSAAALPPLETKPTVGQELGAVLQNKVEITFASGSATLSPDAAKELDVAARLFRDVGPAVMFAIGHTDGQGDEFSNIILGAERARAVKQALLARGIPPDRLYIQSLGQSEPLTRREPLAPANRRVVVQWQII